MRDPLTWSLSLGRWLGIQVRLHVFFVAFVVLQLVDALIRHSDRFFDTAGLQAILFFSVLSHEFGHCLAARWVGGSASEILMWPLGGLAYVQLPNLPRAHLITTVAGPAVNLVICAGTAGFLLSNRVVPALNPFRLTPALNFEGQFVSSELFWWVGYVYWVNSILFLFNLLPAFPMDGGRVFRCLLWPSFGFARATLIAVQVAKVAAIAMVLVGLLAQEFLLIGVAVFVYVTSEMERRMLAEGMLLDDSVFGYNFSQGYTSLDPPPRPRRVGFLERWRCRRERQRRERDERSRADDEQRVDAILQKLHESGMDSLSDSEKQFLRDVSARLRGRDRAR